MVSFPPCKINLGLQILRKRTDGYHDIHTCFYPLPFTDIIEIIRGDAERFTTSGNLVPGPEQDNLCLKAYHLLQRDFNLPPVQIHLHKIIPTGAGLGGGSSDAAHTLRLLNTIFSLGLTRAKLQTYASSLGSDCPFFIDDVPMQGTGRGEILEPTDLRLNGKYLVLINPELHISTADAYAGVQPASPPMALNEILSRPLEEWRALLKNDFETSIFKKFPLIMELKEQLYEMGALYAAMSGSGSTVFGIFDHDVSLSGNPRRFLIWSGSL